VFGNTGVSVVEGFEGRLYRSLSARTLLVHNGVRGVNLWTEFRPSSLVTVVSRRQRRCSLLILPAVPKSESGSCLILRSQHAQKLPYFIVVSVGCWDLTDSLRGPHQSLTLDVPFSSSFPVPLGRSCFHAFSTSLFSARMVFL